MILAAFRQGFQSRSINALYGMIVAQARAPVFYADYGVPDTMDGRFEMIVLHLVLLLGRLDRSDAANGSGRNLGQLLFDAFCRDLDDNLREMGVGDMAVPRRMRRFAEAFYGRQAAYRAAFESCDPAELEKAMARNIFGTPDADERAARLARYARAAAAGLLKMYPNKANASASSPTRRSAARLRAWRGCAIYRGCRPILKSHGTAKAACM
jgi:cytochrome b pre-mRNA-processing protein 3